ncbi:Vms1/Ankzf1 family peptidyl-tRNA hydrolase, partial [Chloroflexota bacterium]
GGIDSTPLISLLQQDFKLALVLVRLGAYAVGISQGEKLVACKVGTGLVHGRHRQGGSSAARFQRRRKNQADHFLDRVCEHAQEKLQPYVKDIDYLIYGGAHTTILSLQKVCSFLRRFEGRTLPSLLDIQKPNQAELESAVRLAWLCKITEWREDTVEI